MPHDLKYHSIVQFCILVPINSCLGFFDLGKSLIKFQDSTPLFFYTFYISRFLSCPKHKKVNFLLPS